MSPASSKLSHDHHTIPVEIAGERLLALPEKCLFWPAGKTLFFADPHFGKDATFRAGGLPVPQGGTAVMLSRLDAALTQTGAERLVCLGDLLHARSSLAAEVVDAVAGWRQTHPALDCLVVRGNHDRHAGDPPAAWRMRMVEEGEIQRPFVLCHHPQEHPDGYVLAGHLHPGYALAAAGQQLLLPCFYFGKNFAILPAFGEFTGLARVPAEPDAQILVVAEERLFALPNGR